MLDVNPHNGRIRLNFADISAMTETCSLDIADQVAERRRPLELQAVGALLGLSGEAARLAEVRAIEELERVL